MFYENGVEVTTKRGMANEFNNFFVNVAPALAKNKIAVPHSLGK